MMIQQHVIFWNMASSSTLFSQFQAFVQTNLAMIDLSQESLFWIVGIVALSITALGVIFHALDKSLNKGTNFYPSSLQIYAINFKLFSGSLFKGSSWKKLVRSDKPELDSVKLKRELVFEPNIKHVAKFKEICLLKDGVDAIPFIYPATLVLYPNMCLFGSASYPFPAMGCVHVFNTTILHRKLSTDETFNCILQADKTIRPAKKGSEVQFNSALLDKQNQTAWTNSSTFLILHKQKNPPPAAADSQGSPPATEDLTLLFEDTWPLGGDASVKYAAVSKDYNPIHMSSIAAKAFGFPGVIMHGMYMITRAASECQAVMGENIVYPVEVSTKFQRPCVLPDKTVKIEIFSVKKEIQNLYFKVTNVAKKTGEVKILLDGFFKSLKK